MRGIDFIMAVLKIAFIGFLLWQVRKEVKYRQLTGKDDYFADDF